MRSTIPGGIFDPQAKKEEVLRLEQRASVPSFWNDREKAERLLTRIKILKEGYEPWEKLRSDWEDCHTLLLLALEGEDSSLEGEITQGLEDILGRLAKLTTKALLSEEKDPLAAFLAIHSGAGGREACDWVNMLYRMYTRWIETRGWRWTVIDLVEADEGIKTISLQVSGSYAYGFLKGESGVHRLVRISPFDANARRHTSFASVYVSPAIGEEDDIELKPDEIRVDTYRSSGAGGQHVNKTDSAVRITHLETGIVVQCQNDRSQIKNKKMAMQVLKSRLYEHARQRREEERAKTEAEKLVIGWGSQIRSYVFQPYTMVKDVRTRAEMGDIRAVMDGKIDPFIDAYLRHRATLGHKLSRGDR